SEAVSATLARSFSFLLDQHSTPTGEPADAGGRTPAELQLPQPRGTNGARTCSAAARSRSRADGMDVSSAAIAVLLCDCAGAVSPSAGAADYGISCISLPLGRTAKDGAAEENE